MLQPDKRIGVTMRDRHDDSREDAVDDSYLVEERRTIRRRATDRAEPPTEEQAGPDISEFRLSLREVGLLITFLITIAGAFFNFNSQIEKTKNEQVLLNERMTNRIGQLESKVDSLEKDAAAMKAQVDDLDQVITMMYQHSLKGK